MLELRVEDPALGLTTGQVEEAAAAMRRDGFVVLRDAVSPRLLAELHTRMLEDLPRILARDSVPENFVRGNVQQDPPPFDPYLQEQVYMNPAALAVSAALLGPDAICSFCSGNTNMPGSAEQPVHVDMGQLWPGLGEAHPVNGLAINMTLVDTDERNGSIEVWPGTHLDPRPWIGDPSQQIPLEWLERRRATSPPVRANTRRGDVLVRDLRLWHRGTTNPSMEPRPMIVFVHLMGWMRGTLVEFPVAARAFLSRSPLYRAVHFTNEAARTYLDRHTPVERVAG